MAIACINLGTLGDLRGGVKPEDNEPVWSIRDFINTMNQKPVTDKYGMITWNNLLKGDHKDELAKSFCQLVIPGSQGRETPCANILGLQTIIGLLPGKIAEKYREEARDILNRVITGDKSLITIIEANASTATPTQNLLRGAMKRKQGNGQEITTPEDPEERRIRLRKMEAEIDQMNADTERIRKVTAELAMRSKTECLKVCEEGYIRNCVGGIMEDRARLSFKDMYINISKSTGDGAAVGVSAPGLITLKRKYK